MARFAAVSSDRISPKTTFQRIGTAITTFNILYQIPAEETTDLVGMLVSGSLRPSGGLGLGDEGRGEEEKEEDAEEASISRDGSNGNLAPDPGPRTISATTNPYHLNHHS
ncbi:hypothetical protein TWF192_002461 [Orbilia oligospora]|uniref:Uncharacterized protein n=1 Tax=Orbilia oligospora TaxID=2813651 RepID=A0A6G1LSE7_ORBOL|nr:hypothetical protein TWF191_000199 [Orbilia oligospora]KAF3233263.1 hypothetical protein TWF192_002461 [Orbilia oligospora]